jgi:hypothetical protein
MIPLSNFARPGFSRCGPGRIFLILETVRDIALKLQSGCPAASDAHEAVATVAPGHQSTETQSTRAGRILPNSRALFNWPVDFLTPARSRGIVNPSAT